MLRKVPGNWTFLVVTDRDDLDNQIYKNFRNTGAVTEECQADSGEHLKQLLTEDHRFIFTLIQKFVTKKGQKYPKLSDRSDIIVMTDEAHRSQYDTLALNMRNALPKAAFIGFTGTPLMAGEEKTKEVFGDYVSIYNFRQSIEDGATVPLFYENRIPELQLANENFKEDLEDLIEQAELDDEQEKKLEREFAREYHLITRDDRLEKVAEDLVAHFMGREQGGKGMVICIDKATAVKMYDKVQKHWKAYLADLKAELPLADPLKRPDSGSPDQVHGRDRHGGGRVAAAERGRGVQEEGPGHRAAPQADGEGRPGNQVQGPRRSVPARLRLRHVDDRLRRPVRVHDLPRQADEEPHPDADHRQGEPGLRRKEQRPDRGLRRRVP